MAVWYLILWSAYVPGFEAGQYQTYEKCVAAARVQVPGLYGMYGPGRLSWRCEYDQKFNPYWRRPLDPKPDELRRER